MISVRLPVQDGLDIVVQSIPFREHVVQFVLPQHGPERGLRELANGFEIALDLDDRFFRVDDAEIYHRVDLHRNVVLGYDILCGYVHDDDTQVHALHLLDDRDHDDQPGAFHFPETPKLKNDPPLIFTEDLDRVNDDAQQRQSY